MLRLVALALAALALGAPLAAAGPVSDSAQGAAREVGAVACGADPGVAPPQACLLLWQISGWPPVADAAVAAFDTAAAATCAQPETVPCRALTGRPVAGGALDVCRERPAQPALPGVLLWQGAQLVDGAVRGATTAHLAGTPLEGESLCHDHRTTARALLALL